MLTENFLVLKVIKLASRVILFRDNFCYNKKINQVCSYFK